MDKNLVYGMMNKVYLAVLNTVNDMSMDTEQTVLHIFTSPELALKYLHSKEMLDILNSEKYQGSDAWGTIEPRLLDPYNEPSNSTVAADRIGIRDGYFSSITKDVVVVKSDLNKPIDMDPDTIVYVEPSEESHDVAMKLLEASQKDNVTSISTQHQKAS